MFSIEYAKIWLMSYFNGFQHCYKGTIGMNRLNYTSGIFSSVGSANTDTVHDLLANEDAKDSFLAS